MDPQIEELVGQLDSQDAGTRLLAIQALVAMTGPDVLAALRVAAESPDSNVRTMARKALSGRWTKAQPALTERLKQVGPVNPGIIAVAPPPEAPRQQEDPVESSNINDEPTDRCELIKRSLLSLVILSLRFMACHVMRALAIGLITSVFCVLVSVGLQFALIRFGLILDKHVGPLFSILTVVGVHFILPLLASIGTIFMLEGLMAKEVTNWYLNKESSLFRNLTFCFSRLWSMLTVSFAWLIVYSIGFVAFSAIGVSAELWLSQKAFYKKLPSFVGYLVCCGPCALFILRCHIMWCFAPAIAIVEDIGGLSGLNRSVKLVRGNVLRVFFLRLVLVALTALGVHFVKVGVAIIGPTLMTSFAPLENLGFKGLQVIGLTILGTIMSPWVSVSIVLLYFDQLVRKEDISLKALARTQRSLEYRGREDTLSNQPMFQG